MNTFLGEVTAKELKEEDVAMIKPKLESMLKEGAVHSEGLMLAVKSYKKWLLVPVREVCLRRTVKWRMVLFIICMALENSRLAI